MERRELAPEKRRLAMTSRLPTLRWVVFAISLAVSLGSPVAADDQQAAEQRPADEKQGQERASASDQPALKSTAPAKNGSSLAEAAARIKLTQPASEGSLVISNANLQKSGAKGTMSVGGGVTASPAGPKPGATTSTGGANPSNALVQQYNDQLRTVESLEVRLKNFDEQLKEPARDPHYPYVTGRPHDRAPGVQDPASAQRDALTKQLEAERAKLNTLRDQARRQGVRLD
jgi:hypothetical protein